MLTHHLDNSPKRFYVNVFPWVLFNSTNFVGPARIELTKVDYNTISCTVCTRLSKVNLERCVSVSDKKALLLSIACLNSSDMSKPRLISIALYKAH